MNLPSKEILFGEEARTALATGIKKLARAVGATLGPRGRLGLISRPYGSGQVTKDGVSVAQEIILPDAAENEGAKLCIDVANRANNQVGDGTTTATVLANALVEEGIKRIHSGANPVLIKKGIEAAIEATLQILTKMKRDVSVKDSVELGYVANISGNGSDVGDFVAKAFECSAERAMDNDDVIVIVESGTDAETVLNTSDGVRFDSGWFSPWFQTSENKAECVFEDPYILTFERKINNVQELLVFMDKCFKMKIGPLVIISESVEGDALATMVLNHHRKAYPCVAVRAPGFGERRKNFLKDLSVLCGSKHFPEEMGAKLEQVEPSDLGRAKKIVVTGNSFTIIPVEQTSEQVRNHVDFLRNSMEEAEYKADKEKLKERISKLTNTVSIIKVGGKSESEVSERKDRFEDAVNSTRAAIESGIIPGGGAALARASMELALLEAYSEDERTGIEIVRRALLVPLQTIAENSGVVGPVIAEKVISLHENSEGRFPGFDARNGVMVPDMFEAGIIDPLKVATVALSTAASIATLILMTESLIIEKPEPPKASPSG